MPGELRQPEVHDLDLTLVVHHDVGRFDVAMNDTLLMRRLQALGGLRGDVDHLVELEQTIADFVLDGLSLDESHGEEGLSLGLVDFKDGANVGMVERRRGLRLAQETFLGFGVLNGFGAEKLQSNGALELRVEGFIDNPHAAFTEFFSNLVMRYGMVDHDGSILLFLRYAAPAPLGKSTLHFHLPSGFSGSYCSDG